MGQSAAQHSGRCLPATAHAVAACLPHQPHLLPTNLGHHHPLLCSRTRGTTIGWTTMRAAGSCSRTARRAASWAACCSCSSCAWIERVRGLGGLLLWLNVRCRCGGAAATWVALCPLACKCSCRATLHVTPASHLASPLYCSASLPPCCFSGQRGGGPQWRCAAAGLPAGAAAAGPACTPAGEAREGAWIARRAEGRLPEACRLRSRLTARAGPCALLCMCSAPAPSIKRRCLLPLLATILWCQLTGPSILRPTAGL